MSAEKLKKLETLCKEFLSLNKKANKASELTVKKIAAIQQLASRAIQNHDPYQQNTAEVQAAKAVLSNFEQDNNSSSAFKNLDKGTLLQELRDRIDSPEDPDQDRLNLCGAATFTNVWLQRDPEGYAKAVIELYQTGKTTYNDIKIKANKKMFDQAPSGTNVLDWLLLSSLQNAGGLLGYNPEKELGGLRGIALPGKMMKWFESLPDTETKKYRKDRTAAQLNVAIKAGSSVIFLVNMTAFDNYITDRKFPDTKFDPSVVGNLTGNHYIILASEVKMNGGNLEFDIWTWATEYMVSIPEKAYKKAVKKTFVITDDDGEE